MFGSVPFLGQVRLASPIHLGQWGLAVAAAAHARKVAREAQAAAAAVNTPEARGWAAKADEAASRSEAAAQTGDAVGAQTADAQAEAAKNTVLALQAGAIAPLPSTSTSPGPAVFPTTTVLVVGGLAAAGLLAFLALK